MNTPELIDAVASATGQTKANAKNSVDAALAAISNELAAGNEVNLHGFGKFKVAERGERQGRNPATGEAITIAASKSVKFSAAKAVKDRL